MKYNRADILDTIRVAGIQAKKHNKIAYITCTAYGYAIEWSDNAIFQSVIKVTPDGCVTELAAYSREIIQETSIIR